MRTLSRIGNYAICTALPMSDASTTCRAASRALSVPIHASTTPHFGKKSARIISDPGVLRSRPELAVLVGDVISLWSHIEANLSIVLTRMLGGGVRSGSAMYQAVQSFRVQMTILNAVAKIEISHEYLLCFCHDMIRITLNRRMGPILPMHSSG
jgi:hypothetical protein